MHPLAVLNVSGPTLLTALQVQHQYSSLIITRETAAWSVLHPGLYRAAGPSPRQAHSRKSQKTNDYQKPGYCCDHVYRDVKDHLEKGSSKDETQNCNTVTFLCLNFSVSLMRRRCGHTLCYSTVLTPLLTSHNPLVDFIIHLILLINKQLYSGPLSGPEKTLFKKTIISTIIIIAVSIVSILCCNIS